MQILSIQSAVAYGHVGNSAAVFPLQRLGIEVWPVPTVNFSNHTGYGDWRGTVLPAAEVGEVIRGVEERGALSRVDAVLSGYQGGPDIGEVIIDTVARVKAANPQALYACDPVMGNAISGCFVHAEIPMLMRERVVPVADLITPNQFELGLLTDTEPRTLEETMAAVSAVTARGPRTVLVTSVARPEVAADTVEMLAVHHGPDGEEAWLIGTPRLPRKVDGSGDVTAALFTAHLLRGGSARDALELTTASVFDLLTLTMETGGYELQLVAAQEAIAHPEVRYRAERVR